MGEGLGEEEGGESLPTVDPHLHITQVPAPRCTHHPSEQPTHQTHAPTPCFNRHTYTLHGTFTRVRNRCLLPASGSVPLMRHQRARCRRDGREHGAGEGRAVGRDRRRTTRSKAEKVKESSPKSTLKTCRVSV